MDNLSDVYKAYGESVATRLRDIAHSETQRTFVFVEDIDNPVEVLTYTSSGKAPEGSPLLVWDNFDEDLSTGGRDNYHLAITGTFSVLQKATAQLSKQKAYRDCRAIVLKALALMIADSETGMLNEADIQVEVQKFPLEKVGPVSTSWYGYGVQFSWVVPIDLSLDPDDLMPA